MATKYECLTCGSWLSHCRCAEPVVAVRGQRLREFRPHSREEAAALLREEVQHQEADGRARVRSARSPGHTPRG